MRIVFGLFAFCLAFQMNAQTSSVNSNIKEAFANYQTSFQHANGSQQTIVSSLQNAMAEKDVKNSSSEAKDQVRDAKQAAEEAAENIREAFEASQELNCKSGSLKLKNAHESFHDAKDHFGEAESILREVPILKKMDDVADAYIKVSSILKDGVGKLNAAIQDVNGSMSTFKSCK